MSRIVLESPAVLVVTLPLMVAIDYFQFECSGQSFRAKFAKYGTGSACDWGRESRSVVILLPLPFELKFWFFEFEYLNFNYRLQFQLGSKCFQVRMMLFRLRLLWFELQMTRVRHRSPCFSTSISHFIFMYFCPQMYAITGRQRPRHRCPKRRQLSW